VCEAKDTFNILEPEKVKISIASNSNFHGFGVSCSGKNDGEISVLATGGTNIFNYSWSDGKTTALNNQLPKGTYKVIVSDNNGCKDSLQHEITSPDVLAIEIARIKHISCYNGKNGEIALKATGGVANYQYSIRLSVEKCQFSSQQKCQSVL
jgi:hypothetical protein